MSDTWGREADDAAALAEADRWLRTLYDDNWAAMVRLAALRQRLTAGGGERR